MKIATLRNGYQIEKSKLENTWTAMRVLQRSYHGNLALADFIKKCMADHPPTYSLDRDNADILRTLGLVTRDGQISNDVYQVAITSIHEAHGRFDCLTHPEIDRKEADATELCGTAELLHYNRDLRKPSSRYSHRA